MLAHKSEADFTKNATGLILGEEMYFCVFIPVGILINKIVNI